MKFLITGATGRIGSAVLHRLPEDVEVWTTSRGAIDQPRHIRADLGDAGATSALIDEVHPDVVVHIAGYSGTDQQALFESNVMAAVNLVQSVATKTRVIVLGSAAEYGTPATPLATEDTPMSPVSAYGWSKVAQTHLAMGIGKRRGIEVVIARPFNVVSPDMPRTTAIGNIAHQINTHESTDTLQLIAGRLDVLRDFIPLSFVGESIVAMALAPEVENTYNICSGHGFVLRELVDAMASLRNLRLEATIDPDLAAIPAVDGIVGDPTRIASLTDGGWEPSATELASIALRRSVPNRYG